MNWNRFGMETVMPKFEVLFSSSMDELREKKNNCSG
jgi:hypothetical protein